PNKCLNCHKSVHLLQHLLQSPSPGPPPTEVLSYIFGLQDTLLLKLLNITELTFCADCSQLLAAMGRIREKFIAQTSKSSYLYHAILRKSSQANHEISKEKSGDK